MVFLENFNLRLFFTPFSYENSHTLRRESDEIRRCHNPVVQIRRIGNNIIYGWPGATETDMEELLAFYNAVDDDDQPTGFSTLEISILIRLKKSYIPYEYTT